MWNYKWSMSWDLTAQILIFLRGTQIPTGFDQLMLQMNNSEYKCMVLMLPCLETMQSSLPLSPSLPLLQPAPCSEEWLLVPALSRLPCLLLISGCVCPMGSTNRGSENWRRERSGCSFSWLPPEGLQLWWYILILLATASFTGTPLL